jgi:hypothetical protein
MLGVMENERRFVAVDPVTDQVLWVCAGPTAQGTCEVAEKPPYACQGLRLLAASGTQHDGQSISVDKAEAGVCPALTIA